MKQHEWKDPITERYKAGIRTLTMICLRNMSADPMVDRTRQEAAEIGAECVERLLTPKKVVFRENENGPVWDWYLCPVCGKRLRKNQPAPHCPACGQLLDWNI